MAEKKKSPSRRRRRVARVTEIREAPAALLDLMRKLGISLSPGTTVSVLPKVIDVDWEDDDPGTENVIPSPSQKGLYVGDYVVWRNHTDVDLVVVIDPDKWPFSSSPGDINVPANSDSAAYKVASEGAWYYVFEDFDGPPGGPSVVVPGG